MIVAGALLLLALALEDAAGADELALLELELLEPQAATPSDAATTRATALMRLLLTVLSPYWVCGISLGGTETAGVIQL